MEGVNRFTVKRGRFKQKFCLETDLAAYKQTGENGSQIKEENYWGLGEGKYKGQERSAFMFFFLFLITSF